MFNRVVFVINNWTPEEEEHLKAQVPEKLCYVLWAREIAPSTGTPHLQGYAEFKKRTRQKAAKAIIGQRANLIRPVGNQKSNIKYIKDPDKPGKPKNKPEDIFEYGTPKRQGTRTDIKEAKECIRGMKRRRDLIRSEELAPFYLKHAKYCEAVFADHISEAFKKPYEPEPGWQTDLMARIEQKADPRKVHWYWSEKGSVGKSTTARGLKDHHEAMYADGGDYTNLAYTYDYEPIIVFNFARDKDLSKVSYRFMEAAKDGIVCSTKYVPVTKRFDPPHVIVFANAPPPEGALSQDRLDIHYIE